MWSSGVWHKVRKGVGFFARSFLCPFSFYYQEPKAIPILQAKFYYIPPLEGRFQTFLGIDIWHSIPHCSTMRNWSIPHVWGIEIVSTVENWNHAISIPHVWRIEIQKFCVQYGNVSPSPRRKRDWVKFPICHLWQSHSWLMGNFIFHHLWLRHYVVKNPIPFSPR